MTKRPNNGKYYKRKDRMKDMASKFTEDDLREIGEYIAARYPVLKSGGVYSGYGDIKIDLYERMVRVEEELKHQRELILNVMKMMDKRFEDLRNDMNRRFSMLMWFIGIGFTLFTTIITGVFVLLR